MKLHSTTENYRELVTGYLTDALLEGQDVDGLADELAQDVGRELADFDLIETHRQSVGSFVIFQSGTAAERAAFDAAVDKCISALRASIIARA